MLVSIPSHNFVFDVALVYANVTSTKRNNKSIDEVCVELKKSPIDCLKLFTKVNGKDARSVKNTYLRMALMFQEKTREKRGGVDQISYKISALRPKSSKKLNCSSGYKRHSQS